MVFSEKPFNNGLSTSRGYKSIYVSGINVERPFSSETIYLMVFHQSLGRDDPIFHQIFFRCVGSTTNLKLVGKRWDLFVVFGQVMF